MQIAAARQKLLAACQDHRVVASAVNGQRLDDVRQRDLSGGGTEGVVVQTQST